ncbi:hypothetical protein BJV78DRAFT_1313379 [Lactifluus subvellereus]|nr:hypothetical protein BJV78DRAFT_1313379 [Lactifluus subvellereus]
MDRQAASRQVGDALQEAEGAHSLYFLQLDFVVVVVAATDQKGSCGRDCASRESKLRTWSTSQGVLPISSDWPKEGGFLVFSRMNARSAAASGLTASQSGSGDASRGSTRGCSSQRQVPTWRRNAKNPKRKGVDRLERPPQDGPGCQGTRRVGRHDMMWLTAPESEKQQSQRQLARFGNPFVVL